MICPSLVENWYEWSHAIIEDRCPECQSDQVKMVDQINCLYQCEACKANFAEDDSDDFEVMGRTYRTIQYKADQQEEGNNIVVLQSPYYTWARLCSQCYPNAGNLDQSIATVVSEESGYKTYCFGHNWFENGVAPYPLIRVSDNRLMTRPARQGAGRPYPRQAKKKSSIKTKTPLIAARPIILDF